MKIGIIILVVFVLAVVGYLLYSAYQNKKSDEDVAATSKEDALQAQIDAKNNKLAAVRCGMPVKNQKQAIRFQQILRSKGRACVGPAGLARRWTSVLNNRGRCLTWNQSLHC